MREEAGEGGVHRQGRRRAEAKVKTAVLDAFFLDQGRFYVFSVYLFSWRFRTGFSAFP